MFSRVAKTESMVCSGSCHASGFAGQLPVRMDHINAQVSEEIRNNPGVRAARSMVITWPMAVLIR